MSFKQERIKQILEWISKRVLRPNMYGLYRHKFFKGEEHGPESFLATKPQFYSDYSTAKKLIKKHTAGDREDRIAEGIFSRMDIINQTKELGDFRTALAAEKDLAELTGLYEKDGGEGVRVVFNFDGDDEDEADTEQVQTSPETEGVSSSEEEA